MSIEERIKGCFLGLVAGDALGGPIEFMSENEIKKRCGGPITEMLGGGWLCLEPGEYTDDSEMAIAITESIIEKNGWDPDDVAMRFVNWYKSKPKDIGGTTRQALALIKHFIPWQEAGQQVHEDSGGFAAGNGSLMRSAPIAIFGHKLPAEELIRISHEGSTITHADPRCLWSCAALNLSIAFILRGDLDKKSILQKTLDYIENEDVARTLREAEIKKTKLSVQGFVLDTLKVAFHDFLHTPSFEEAVVTAVNRGGDADTQGAVIGSLAGAYYGFSQIPKRWLEKLNNLEKLRELARKLGDCHAKC